MDVSVVMFTPQGVRGCHCECRCLCVNAKSKYVCVLHYISVFVSFVVLFTRTQMKFLQQFVSNIFPQSFHVQGHEDIFFFQPSVEPGNNGSMLPIGAIKDNKWATHNVLMCVIVDKTRRKQSLLLFCFIFHLAVIKLQLGMAEL